MSTALDILAGLRPPPRTRLDHLRPCDGAEPILVNVAADLGRLLGRTRGPRRQEVLETIEKLQMRRSGERVVAALVHLLGDRELGDRAAVLLRTIGPPASAAAVRLGQLLATAGDLHAESIYASSIAAIRAPSPAAAAALPARLDEAEKTAGAAPRRFVTLFAAAVAAGPPAGQSRDDWTGALVSRAQAAVGRIGATSRDPWPERDLIIALARLPRTPQLVAMLESAMSDQTATIDRRFWSAWALRSIGAPLSPAAAGMQAQLVGPPEQPLLAAPEPDAPLPPLRAAEISAAMGALRPTVSACYARDKVAAAASVKVEIAYGRVVSATVTDRLGGTPTAACIESAVQTATFPLAERFSTTLPFAP